MAYNIKDQKTDELIQPILDSIREACENESQRERKKSPLWDRLQPLVSRVAAAPKTRKKADKAFFDELSGDAQ